MTNLIIQTFPLGSSLCAQKLVMMKNEGLISDKDFYKICNFYNKYTSRSNALWESNLDHTSKRHFDMMLLKHTLEGIKKMPMESELVTRLTNVIISHHKSTAKLYKINKPIKRKFEELKKE